MSQGDAGTVAGPAPGEAIGIETRRIDNTTGTSRLTRTIRMTGVDSHGQPGRQVRSRCLLRNTSRVVAGRRLSGPGGDCGQAGGAAFDGRDDDVAGGAYGRGLAVRVDVERPA